MKVNVSEIKRVKLLVNISEYGQIIASNITLLVSFGRFSVG